MTKVVMVERLDRTVHKFAAHEVSGDAEKRLAAAVFRSKRTRESVDAPPFGRFTALHIEAERAAGLVVVIVVFAAAGRAIQAALNAGLITVDERGWGMNEQTGEATGRVIVDMRPRPRTKKMNSRSRRNRKARLIWAQSNTCAHCEMPFPLDYDPEDDDAPTIEHVLAKSCGGTNRIENLLVKHKTCNLACGNRPPSMRDLLWQAIVSVRLGELARGEVLIGAPA